MSDDFLRLDDILVYKKSVTGLQLRLEPALTNDKPSYCIDIHLQGTKVTYHSFKDYPNKEIALDIGRRDLDTIEYLLKGD